MNWYTRFLVWVYYIAMTLDGVMGVLSLTLFRPKLALRVAKYKSRIQYKNEIKRKD